MKIVNLTPHTVQLHGFNAAGDKAGVTLPSSGCQARLLVTRTTAGTVETDGGITLAVVRPTMGDITGLPSPTEGVIYIVSALVAEKAKRADVFAPGELLRDAAGVVVGAKGLTTYSP